LSRTTTAWALNTAFRLNPRERAISRIERKLRSTFYADYWAKVAGNLGAICTPYPRGLLRLSTSDGAVFVREQYVQMDDGVTLEIAGDKQISQALLAEIGLPVPRFTVLTSRERPNLNALLNDFGPPIVCKPAKGYAGLAVTTGITQTDQLSHAIRQARLISEDVVVEEQISGENYRLLFLRGELVDALHRRRPSVIGDGKSNLRALIARENSIRAHGDPITSLFMLRVTAHAENYLKSRGLTIRAVPRSGEVIELSDVVNRSAARDNTSLPLAKVTHFADLGVLIRKTLPIDLLAVDIITSDITAPDGHYMINEINTTPGLHHHALVSNPDDAPPIGEKICRSLLAGLHNAQSPRTPTTHATQLA
jgi:D-alanine-D-alanine ligase-like ATP-grasp enzyme